MPNCKSFLVTEAERKHDRRRARFQQRRDACCHQIFFPTRQGAAETWLDGQPSDFFSLSGLQKLEQWAKNCIEVRGEYVE